MWAAAPREKLKHSAVFAVPYMYSWSSCREEEVQVRRWLSLSVCNCRQSVSGHFLLSRSKKVNLLPRKHGSPFAVQLQTTLARLRPRGRAASRTGRLTAEIRRQESR